MNLNERFDLAAIAKGKTRRKSVEFRPISHRLKSEQTLYFIVAEIAKELDRHRDHLISAATITKRNLVMDTVLDDVMAELERGMAQIVRLSRQKTMSLFEGDARRHDETWMQQVNRVVGVDLKAVISSTQIKPAIDVAVQRNVALIKGLSDDVAKRVEVAILDLASRGASTKEITKALQDIGGFTKSRARLIALTETAKFNGQLNEIRQKQAGITKYTWSTVGDSRVRPSHRARNGQTFSWDDPPSGGPPGSEPRCRCVARAILDFDEKPMRSNRQRAREAGLAAVGNALGL